MRILIASALVLIAAGSAYSYQSADVRKAMEQKEQEFEKAFKAKDASWFKKVSTSDFVAIDQHGKKYTKEQAVAQMAQLFSAMTIESVHSSIKTLKSAGKNVLVVTETTLKGTIAGQGGKKSTLVDTSTDEETWVRTGKDWKIKIDKTTSDKATLDGKPFTGM